MDKDTLRSAALAGACAGFVAVPVLGPLLGGGEQSEQYDTVITPPGYAFVVWAPLFAGCIVNTVEQCRPRGRATVASRRTGWPLAAAYAANTAWSIAAQSRFELTPVILPVATGCTAVAHARLQRLPPATGWARVNSLSTALLLGWTALASTVNLAAGALVLGAGKTSPTTVATSAAGLAAASGLLAGAAASSPRGGVPLALASGWGLLTTALTTSRPSSVRAVAGSGAVGIGAAAVWRTVQARAEVAR